MISNISLLKRVLCTLLVTNIFFTYSYGVYLNEKPNIIIIIADDLGWMDVGYNGADYYETPNIDKLAKEGMIFNRFYPSAANCAPSRASLLTGMYSPRHQVYLPQGVSRGGDASEMRFKVPTQGQNSTFNTFSVSRNSVSPEFESIAEVVKKSEYVTARMGKWHIGDDNQGFDVISANGDNGYTTNFNGKEKRFYDDIHVAERLTDASLDFIDSNTNNPFLLYLSHWEVHTPMAARENRIDHFRKKLKKWPNREYDPIYAAEIEQVDISVGRILSKLKENDLDENTIVIFTSDNGGLTSMTSNAPLRAGKGTFYEGGIRNPFCISWPGVIKPGSKTDIPANGIDLLPTIAEITSAKLPEDQPIDGCSLLPILRGESFLRKEPLYFHFPLYLGGGRDISVLPSFRGQKNYWRAVPSTTVISEDWKLIYYYEYDLYELYNLENDISESDDLSKIETEVAVRLLEKLNQWTDAVYAPIPTILNKR